MTIIVKDWKEHFEKADNRRLKVFSWVAVPTKMDGKKFRRLSKMKDGMEIFGTFILLLELAGKMPEKGVLRDADGDLGFEDMELMTGFPSKYFKNAIQVLCSDEIGWLQDDTRATPGHYSGDTQPTIQDSTEQNNTEQNTGADFLNSLKSEFEYLNNPDFETAFRDHMTGNKKTTKTEKAIRARLKKLHGFPLAVAQAALNDALSNGWQGVFPESVKGLKTPQKTFAQLEDERLDDYMDRLQRRLNGEPTTDEPNRLN